MSGVLYGVNSYLSNGIATQLVLPNDFNSPGRDASFVAEKRPYRVFAYSKNVAEQAYLNQSSMDVIPEWMKIVEITDDNGNTKYAFGKLNGFLDPHGYNFAVNLNVVSDKLSIVIPSKCDFDNRTIQHVRYRLEVDGNGTSAYLDTLHIMEQRGWSDWDGYVGNTAQPITDVTLKRVLTWTDSLTPSDPSQGLNGWTAGDEFYQKAATYDDDDVLVVYDSDATSPSDDGYYVFVNGADVQRLHYELPSSIDQGAIYEMFINGESTFEFVQCWNMPVVMDFKNITYANKEGTIRSMPPFDIYIKWLIKPRVYWEQINWVSIWHDLIDDMADSDTDLTGIDIPGVDLGFNPILDANGNRVTDRTVTYPDRIVWPLLCGALAGTMVVFDFWDVIFMVYLWRNFVKERWSAIAIITGYLMLRDERVTWLDFFPTEEGYFSGTKPGTFKDLMLTVVIIDYSIKLSRVLGANAIRFLSRFVNKQIEKRGVHLKDIRLLLSSDERASELTSLIDKVHDWSYDADDDVTLHDINEHVRNIIDPIVSDFTEEQLANLFPDGALFGVPGVLALLKDIAGQELNLQTFARRISRFL